MTPWPTRRQADTDDTFDADWRAAYRAAFVQHAVARNWSPENAEEWAGEMDEAALIHAAADHGYDPEATALVDVIACEDDMAACGEGVA